VIERPGSRLHRFRDQEEGMRMGLLGTGPVSQRLAGRLAGLGHEVMIGTRDVEALMARTEGAYDGSPAFADWRTDHPTVRVGTFADAAAFAEMVWNATAGAASLEALAMAGTRNLDGKILVDVANPLDVSHRMPPTLSVCNTDSLAEQIQRAFPGAKVVKTLNTVNARLMVDPAQVGGGDHHVFVSGNDQEAKSEVTRLLVEGFGWTNVLDLGDITSARAAEMYLPLWLRLFAAVGNPMVNVKVVW
jgi:predicted dinucleotide-binding enzyme